MTGQPHERKGRFCGHSIKSNELRREHYKLVRDAGFNKSIADRLRDWSLNHINLFLDSNVADNPKVDK